MPTTDVRLTWRVTLSIAVVLMPSAAPAWSAPTLLALTLHVPLGSRIAMGIGGTGVRSGPRTTPSTATLPFVMCPPRRTAFCLQSHRDTNMVVSLHWYSWYAIKLHRRLVQLHLRPGLREPYLQSTTAIIQWNVVVPVKMDTVTAMDSGTTDARLKVNVAPADGVATGG